MIKNIFLVFDIFVFFPNSFCKFRRCLTPFSNFRNWRIKTNFTLLSLSKLYKEMLDSDWSECFSQWDCTISCCRWIRCETFLNFSSVRLFWNDSTKWKTFEKRIPDKNDFSRFSLFSQTLTSWSVSNDEFKPKIYKNVRVHQNRIDLEPQDIPEQQEEDHAEFSCFSRMFQK